MGAEDVGAADEVVEVAWLAVGDLVDYAVVAGVVECVGVVGADEWTSCGCGGYVESEASEWSVVLAVVD